MEEVSQPAGALKRADTNEDSKLSLEYYTAGVEVPASEE
jgi:hypothetical protein